MLPTMLTLTVLLLFPSISYGNQRLSFTSHRQLDLRDPSQILLTQNNEGVQNGYFNPSNVYPLPSNTVYLKSQPTLVYRPRSVDVLHRTRLRSLQLAENELQPVLWDLVEVEGPAVENLHTLSQLARMSGNAYALPGQKNWYEVDHAWNRVRSFSRSIGSMTADN